MMETDNKRQKRVSFFYQSRMNKKIDYVWSFSETGEEKKLELRREDRWEYRGKSEREAGGSNGNPGWKEQKYENIFFWESKKKIQERTKNN